MVDIIGSEGYAMSRRYEDPLFEIRRRWRGGESDSFSLRNIRHERPGKRDTNAG